MDSRAAPTVKAVYTVIERGQGQKPFWLRIGAAFVNRDQSLTVKLNALPMNGTLQVRDVEPHAASAGSGASRGEDDIPF